MYSVFLQKNGGNFLPPHDFIFRDYQVFICNHIIAGANPMIAPAVKATIINPPRVSAKSSYLYIILIIYFIAVLQ